MASFGKIILDYGDYLIRESEIDILKSRDWLNDVIIGFYFDYLGREVFPENKAKMKFVGPEITQCLKFCGSSDIGDLMGDISELDFIFWPLNNSDDVEQSESAGTHWSLLCYSRPENVLAHFDSSYGMNNSSAKSFASLISPGIKSSPTFHNRETIPQQNGYDCGLHSILNAQIIAEHSSVAKGIDGVVTAKPIQAHEMRKKILDLIDEKRIGSGDTMADD